MPIVFAVNASSGKNAPFQVDVGGEWSVVNGIAKHVGKAPETPIAGVATVERYTSHFAKCPSANDWRKRK